MSLKFQIQNTEAAIKAWTTVDPDAVSYKLKFFREDWYPVGEPPSCGSAACFAGHLPYFPHFSGMGVRAGEYGIPFLEMLPVPFSQTLSEYLFGDPYLCDQQSNAELGTAHEAVAARLRDNLERLLARELELGEAKRRRSTKEQEQ